MAGQPGETRSTARAAISETAATTATTLPAKLTGGGIRSAGTTQEAAR